MEKNFKCPDGKLLSYQVDDFTDPWLKSQTIVFVHGFAESGEVWRGWVPYFARHFRVVRVDVRGYGRSTPMPEDFPWSMDVLVGDLAGLIRHLDCGPVHLVGAKSGGAMTFKLAAEHPELVRTLTGITPSVRSQSQVTNTWLKQIQEQGLLWWARDTMPGRLGSAATPEESEWWIANLQGKTPLSTIVGYLRMVPDMDVRGVLHKIACPTLVIMTAGKDRRSTDSYKEWQQTIPNSELKVVEGDAWHPSGAYPDLCAQIVLPFVERH